MQVPPTILAKERSALLAHRAALRSGAALPPPKPSETPTFAHGFMLPFVLIAATLREARLRRRYLRMTLVRTAIVAVLAVAVIGNGGFGPDHDHDEASEAATKPDPAAIEQAVREALADVGVEDDGSAASGKAKGLAVKKAVEAAKAQAQADAAAARAAAGPKPWWRRAWLFLRHSWEWVVAALAVIAVLQGLVVFFSRRWDDWMGFHASSLARIRPEQAVPPSEPRLAADVKWLYRKARRRWRGYVVFFAGLPVLLPLELLPFVGRLLFTLGATLWGWYWFGVFSAAKSAHAWADEDVAPPPYAIRTLTAQFERLPRFVPLRAYGRLWARLTRGVNAAAGTFERAPRAYLGLALARALLSLPGLYLLARPVVPVAAGRLCAEADPWDRFSAPPAPSLPPPMPGPLCDSRSLGMNEASRSEMRP